MKCSLPDELTKTVPTWSSCLYCPYQPALLPFQTSHGHQATKKSIKTTSQCFLLELSFSKTIKIGNNGKNTSFVTKLFLMLCYWRNHQQINSKTPIELTNFVHCQKQKIIAKTATKFNLVWLKRTQQFKQSQQ